jgi:hypothetical protein
MAYIDGEPKRREGPNDAIERVGADLRILVNDDAKDADYVVPSSPPVLLDPNKPLEP